MPRLLSLGRTADTCRMSIHERRAPPPFGHYSYTVETSKVEKVGGRFTHVAKVVKAFRISDTGQETEVPVLHVGESWGISEENAVLKAEIEIVRWAQTQAQVTGGT